MKKLMITMVALASGLAAWTANAAGDGSQGSSWVASDKTTDTWNGDSLWKSDTEGLLDNAEKVSFVYDETDTSKNCLTLSTGTDIVKRAINADELYTVSQGQYYFDVNMDLLGQALDTVPTLSDDDKFALFLLDCDEFKDSMSTEQWGNVKGTNLCAIALDPKTNNKILLVYNQNDASSLFGGGDSRVTIQAYADVTGNADAPVPGFVVYLNGNSVSEASPLGIEYVVPYDKDNSAPAWANLKSVREYSYLVGKIASSLNQKRLKIAMSLVGGTNGQKMKGLSFAGNAEISSVAMQVDAPIKIEEDSKTVTVKCEHVTVAVETDGFTYDSAKGTLSGEAGQTCTFSVTPEEGYPVIKVIGDVTLAEDGKYTYTYVKGDEISFMAYAIGATATIDGGDAINYASLADLLASDAFANAAESAEIKLNADATIDCLAAEGKAVTLDLNGKTITGKGSENYAAVIYSTGAGLTIKDSSADKTGKVVVAEDAVEGCAAVKIVENESDVSIEAGIFDGAVTVDEYSTAVTISGGSFLASANTATAEPTTGTTTDGGDAAEGETEGETDTPTDTTETTAEPTFALADYVAEGKKAELNEAKDYWVIVDDSTPVAKAWVDYLDEADTDGAYKIDDATDFAQFAQGVADGLATADVTFKLTGNIDLSSSTREDGSTTIGIGVQNAKDMVNQITNEDKSKSDNPDYTNIFVKAAFQGTFDGQNYTISGVILPRTDYAGLFMSAYGATIKNLKVSLGNATGFATGDDNCGGGVIAGVTVNTTIENCETVVAGEFNTFSSNKGMGGIVGYAGGGTTLSNCVNNLNITSTGNEKVGGLIACAEDGYHPSAAGYTGRVIENCTNNGAVTCGASDKAFAAGFVSYASGKVTFKGTCAQNGAVTGTGTKSVQYSIISPNKADLITVDADAVITTTQTGLLSSKQTVDGLNFATIATTDSGSTATFVKNSAAAVNGANLKVMASGATVTLANAGDKITLDESLATATVSVADSLKETYTTEKTEGDNNVNTYTVKAIVWTITYYDDATEPAQFATDTYSVENRAEKTLNAGTRSGYTFKGWKVSADAGVFVVSDYLKTATGNLSLYGVWEEATPAVEPVEPGSETACADETSATTEAAAINNAKTTMIKVPEIEGIDKDTFCNLFTATVVTSGEGETKTYSVKVDLDPTADGVKAIQAVIDEIAKPDADGAVKLDLTKLATETQKATIAAQPGLYYTVYAGEDTPATLDAVKSTQATTATLELEFPKKGTRGFYKIGVSAKEVPVTAAQ